MSFFRDLLSVIGRELGYKAIQQSLKDAEEVMIVK
jgi:hypothetical protein